MKIIQNTSLLLFLPVFFLCACTTTSSHYRKGGAASLSDAAGQSETIDPEIAAMLPREGGALPVSSFREIWAYVVAGREGALQPDLPVSDIGYFGADVNMYGTLVDVPSRAKLAAFPGRVHMVVKCDSRSLSHFVLLPGRPERPALIRDLLNAAKNFDGLQIDFENVTQADAGAFASFLAELRAGLGGKIFSVALPARTGKISNDPYDYDTISAVADRIVVMAYDEHWSGSAPGSIATLSWCKRVADYSLKTISPDKLIMGLPFYGRAWGSVNPSRALVYSGVQSLIDEHRVRNVRRENGIPVFTYEVSVPVTVYYEDEYSLSVRMNMYSSQGVAAIAFWRLGQETQAVWKLLQIKK
ncbi:MAG: glycosyl hydrolase family 18 protein [Treponema sp.]|nr:glycosyl hydrolase family 18 protein [Treponema sp.]